MELDYARIPQLLKLLSNTDCHILTQFIYFIYFILGLQGLPNLLHYKTWINGPYWWQKTILYSIYQFLWIVFHGIILCNTLIACHLFYFIPCNIYIYMTCKLCNLSFALFSMNLFYAIAICIVFYSLFLFMYYILHIVYYALFPMRCIISIVI